MGDDWEAFVALKDVMTIEGQRRRGLLMRRRTMAGWEYREPSPKEEADYVDREAW
jgi:hypothetical protein